MLFEKSPDREFEFYLADRLKMTVGRLREEMPNDEYVMWGIYHQRRAQRAELESKTAGR